MKKRLLYIISLSLVAGAMGWLATADLSIGIAIFWVMATLMMCVLPFKSG